MQEAEIHYSIFLVKSTIHNWRPWVVALELFIYLFITVTILLEGGRERYKAKMPTKIHIEMFNET